MFNIPTPFIGAYFMHKAASKMEKRTDTTHTAEIKKNSSNISEKHHELKRKQTEHVEQQLLEKPLLEKPKTVSSFSSVREFMTKGRKA